MVNIYSSEIKFPWEKEYKTQGICYKCVNKYHPKCPFYKKEVITWISKDPTIRLELREKKVKTIPNHITSCSKFQKCEIEPWHIINTPKTKQNDFYERLINRSPYWQKIEKKEDPLVFINSIHINQLDSNHKLYEISINYFIENDLISYNKKIYNDKIFWDYNFKGSHGELRLSEFKKLLKKYEIKEIK